MNDFSFLIPGDASIAVWEEFLSLREHSIVANGLLLSQNGSRHGFSKKVLDAVINRKSFPAVYQPSQRFKLPDEKVLKEIVKNGGVLINVQNRSARIRLTADRLEIQ